MSSHSIASTRAIELKITPGCTIVGKSGRQLLVDRVEGKSIFCGNLKIEIAAVVKVIPPLRSQDVDRSLENILSVTETLLVVVGMSDEEAIEALIDLRQVWDKELLQAAAEHLSASARSRLRELVVRSNS